MCLSADWFTVESTEVRADSITVISRAVGSSLMRFHATTETAEGQCYDALQQGVPQQPVVPLLLYLPPHTTGSCKAMCEAESPLCGTPWHSLLALPLCRCQEGRVTKCSLSPCIRCWMCFTSAIKVKHQVCLFHSPFVFSEDGCLPYNKPSFPSPGGHSSSGTASSKGSTGPRKAEGPRQPQQWTVTEHADFLGTNGQGQYSGELCE